MRLDAELEVNLAGVRLANPAVLASGILGYTAETLRTIVEGGAGAVVTKSVKLLRKEAGGSTGK